MTGSPAAALPQRLGCVGWLLIGAGLVLVPLGGFAWWFMSERDLDAVLDGPGGRPPLPPAERVAPAVLDPALVALRALAVELVREGGPLARDDGMESELTRTVVPPAIAAVAHRAVAPARAVGIDLDDLLRERGAEDAARTVLRALAVRIACAPPAELPALMDDAVALATLADPGAVDDRLHQALILTDLGPAVIQHRLRERARLLAAALTRRLAELDPAPAAAGTPDAALARTVRGLRAHLWATRAAEEAARVAWRRADRSSRALLAQFGHTGWRHLAGTAQWIWQTRLGRAQELREKRDAWWVRAGAATPAELVARERAESSAAAAAAASGGGIWSLPIPDPYGDLASTLMALDLLAAELDAVAAGGTAADALPPEDAYAPGQRLKPIMRVGAGADGRGPAGLRMIGWYSVGEDGVDDGGRSGLDLGFASGAEELGWPGFGDAVEVPEDAGR